MKARFLALPLSICFMAGLAASCGKKKSSGGGSTATTVTQTITDPESSTVTTESTKLQLSSELVLLPAKGASSSSLTLKDFEQMRLATDAALNVRGNSYDAEARKLSLRVRSTAFESLEEVSNIMCYFSQTQFWKEANTGVYKVIVDGNKCEDSKGDSGSGSGQEGGGGGGGGGGNQESNLMTAYVKAVREENKPLKAEIRFVAEREGKSQEHHAQIIVAAPPSAEDPAGVFAMYFTSYNAGTNAGGGYIKTKRADGGKFVLEFADEGNQSEQGMTMTYGGFATAILEKSGDDFTGKINIKRTEKMTKGSQSFENSNEYKASFDLNFLKVKGSSTQTNFQTGQPETSAVDACYDRSKYVTTIHNYDVVDSSGNLVTLNSGFPIEYTKDGKTYPGHASYWGVHFQGDVTPSHGATVQKVSWGGGSKATSDYTFVKAPGKLVKYTRAQTTLGALKGVDMSMYDSGSSYTVKWDGTSLKKTASVSWGKNGPEETAITDTSAQTITIPDWGLYLYVSSLNAGIKISPDDTFSDAMVINYHSEKVVSGTTDVPSGDLLCFENCPKLSVAATDLVMSMGGGGGGGGNGSCPPVMSSQYKTTSVSYPGPNGTETECTAAQTEDLNSSPIATYTWNNSALTIAEGGVDFAIEDFEKEDGKNYAMVYSGVLIPSATHAALSYADKEMFPGAAQNLLESFYRWQAGADDWSKFSALKDSSGTIATFDKPLEFSYTHTAANDFDGDATNPAVGKPFRLQYGGPGQLWGFPFKYNSDIGYGSSTFSLKAGADLGGGYKAMPVRGDQFTKKAASDSSCSALDLASVPSLPSAENKNLKFTYSDTDNPPLRYIAGEATK